MMTEIFAQGDLLLDRVPDVSPSGTVSQKRANVSVGIKTWGELIDENRARLQFFQEHLQHTADESAAIRYLQEKHSKFLEGIFVEEEIDNSALFSAEMPTTSGVGN